MKCLAPFRSVYLNNGVARPCCWYNKVDLENRQTDLKNVKSVFDSKEFNRIRRQMLSPSPLPEACGVCISHESQGGKSHRDFWNARNFSGDTPVTRDVEPQLKALDVHMGNLCNLKCVMCDSHNSTVWISEEKALFGQAQCSQHKTFDVSSLSPDQLQHVEWLKMAGGEVLLMPQHKLLLQFFIKHGLSEKIELVYVTNNTVSPQEFVEYWLHFKKVRLILSIDGVGPVNEYIRYPSVWAENVSVIREMLELKQQLNLCLEVNTVVSAVNVLYLLELDQWWESFSSGDPVFYRILSHPGYYSLNVLPKTLREKAIGRLGGHMQFSHVEHALRKVHHDQEKLWERFLEMSSRIDQRRGTSLQKVAPGLFN